MTPREILDRYAEAWNGHDAEGVAACFGTDGTYQDPATGGPLRGPGIAAYAQGLFEGFPDVRFDIVNVVEDGAGPLAFEWLMTATNTGPFGGGDPTGREVRLAGADFLAFDPERIAWLRGYFDVQSLLAQLGAAGA
jgi:steroid delta-isomerase-like uncharacterized protein